MKAKLITIFFTLTVIVFFPLDSLAQGNNSTGNVATVQTANCEQAQLIKELVAEIKKMTINLTRLQIGTERVRFQQERVSSILKDLAENKLTLSTLTSSLPQLEEQMKDKEEALRGETDPFKRKQIQEEVKGLKFTIEQQNSLIQFHRERESQLSREFSEEETKLAEAKRVLDTIEQSLAISSKGN